MNIVMLKIIGKTTTVKTYTAVVTVLGNGLSARSPLPHSILNSNGVSPYSLPIQ